MNFLYNQYKIEIEENGLDEKITITNQETEGKEEYNYSFLRKMIYLSSPLQLYFNGKNLEIARYIYWYCYPQITIQYFKDKIYIVKTL